MKNFILSLAMLCCGTLYAQNFGWAGALSGPSTESGAEIATDLAGNVFSTGTFSGTIDADPSAATFSMTSNGGSDIFLQKLDVNGNFVWAKQIGGTENDVGSAITTDSAGNIYYTGSFQNVVDFDPNAGTTNLTAVGSRDMFVVKLNTAGNLQWVRHVGGVSSEAGAGIDVDRFGNVLVTGSFSGTVDFDPSAGVFNMTSNGMGDSFVLKLNGNGDFRWATYLGGPLSLDRGVGVAVDSVGNVYSCGTFHGTADFDPSAGTFNLTALGATDIYVQKLDSNGGFLWARNMTSAPTSATLSFGIDLDAAGNAFTTGVFQGTGDFDPSPAVFNMTSAGGLDMFISKLNASGNFVWAVRVGGASSDEVLDLDVDPQGDVYTCGSFSGTVDFDPGAGVFNLTEVGANDIFVQKLDNNGAFQWAVTVGGTGYDGAEAIEVDQVGNVFTNGFFVNTVDFDPGASVSNLTASGPYDAYTMKLVQCSPSTSNEVVSACGSYAWNGMTLNATGVYRDTILNAGGCDSTMTLNLTINQASSSSATVTACNSYNWNGMTLNTTGVYRDTLLNAGGCDSLMTLNLTINQASSSSATVTACNSYSWNGMTLNSSGTYQDTLMNANGCDSLMTLNLTINQASSSTETTAVCDSYFWNGMTLTSSGVYQDTLMNASGCDSLMTLNLTILQATMATLQDSACDSYLSPSGNYLWTVSGTYADTIPNSQGCDSVLTINLNFISPNVNVTTAPGGMLVAQAQNASFQWIDCGTMQPIPGATNASFQVLQNGSYAVIVTQSGCTDTSACEAVVLDAVPDLIPLEARLYPNPTQGNLHLDLQQSYAAVELTIRNGVGQVLSRQAYTAIREIDFALTGAAGIYFVELRRDGLPPTILKVIKQ